MSRPRAWAGGARESGSRPGGSRSRRARLGPGRLDLPGRPRPQRGAATTLAVVLAGAVAIVATLVSTIGGALVDQRRVASAADLAALAGAAALQHGQDGCAAARSAAQRNAGRLTRCRVVADEVQVTVERRTSSALRRVLQHEVVVSSQARAGPVDALGP